MKGMDVVYGQNWIEQYLALRYSFFTERDMHANDASRIIANCFWITQRWGRRQVNIISGQLIR